MTDTYAVNPSAYSGDHDRLFRPNVTKHSARPAL
jgi:hypothetical protein